MLSPLFWRGAGGEAFAQLFRAGFTVGFVASDVDGMDARDNDNDYTHLGFTLGGIVNTDLSSKYVLQMELNYIQKGHTDLPDSNNNGHYRFSFDYIEIPLLIKRHLHFKKETSFMNKFDIEAGASVGQMVRHSIYQNGSLNPIDMSYVNKTDVSVLVGVDYNFTKNVFFCFRFTDSVIPVIKHGVIPNYLKLLVFNQGANMTAQFTFKFVFGGTNPDNTIPK